MRKPINPKSMGFAKVAARCRPGIAYALLLAFGLQAGAPAWAWEPSRPSVASAIPAGPDLDLGGPTVSEFKTAFPSSAGRAVHKVDPVTFSRYISSHSGQGRLLTGAALSAVVAAAGAPAVKTAPVQPEAAKPAKPKTGRAGARPRLDYENIAAACDSLLLEARPACRDSLKKKALAKNLLALEEHSQHDLWEAKSNGEWAIYAEKKRLRCDTMPAAYRPRCRDSVTYLDTFLSEKAREWYAKRRASLGGGPDRRPARAELEALEIRDDTSVSAAKSFHFAKAKHELDPPYRPPVPFSFKDSIPDPDTNYAAPSVSMTEAETRLHHRKLVRSYKAYGDSVGRDSVAAASGESASKSVAGPPRLLADCDTVAPAVRERCKDSLTGKAVSLHATKAPKAPKAIGEMQERENTERDNRADHTRVDEDMDDDGKHHNWFVNIFADAREGGGGGGGLDSDDWAAIIYVVIGVVVVGAFVIYGVHMLGEMAINQGDYPLFMEAGVRLSYSGKAIQDQQGVGELYRDAYLAGLRFAIGFDRPGMGIGLAAEGGYIDVFLRSASDPSRTFDFKGGYLVAGPMIRFGDNDPWSFSLEFLNGTSTHEAIGWISKSRMTLQAKVSEHVLVGGHLGAVFYDLRFFDGLGLREGNFNRDLSLVWGLDTGWDF